MFLVASESLTETVADHGVLPSYFWTMLLAVALVFLVSMVLYVIGWRVIDKITPGVLNKELVPEGIKPPNEALALVVSAMVLGMSLVLAATIHGVLTH